MPFTAPVSGKYEVLSNNVVATYFYSKSSSEEMKRYDMKPYNLSSNFIKGESAYLLVMVHYTMPGDSRFIGKGYGANIIVTPTASTISKQTSITINNNTWNGNIYTDNSTNLTYIYPQYTTINEKNETVTNISNTPIIYNNETKQYYTYDQTTKNYYYITYNSDPAPSPTPTPDPTDKPGGSISTPETGKPGNSSGSSWWDKLLSKIGDAIIDGLLGAVSAVLKLIFKLFSTILSWIIWAVSRVFDLLPFLPSGLGGLLVGGVVVCFVIGIIKFIRG